MPTWVLTLIFWLHLLGTVTWVGSLAALTWLVLPASHQSLQPADELALIASIQRRLEPLAWFCLSLLVVTGLFQMSVNPHYNGFLALSSQWSIALLVKHVLVLLLIMVSAVHTWEVLPAIRRTRLARSGASAAEMEALRRRERRLLHGAFLLSALILLATAAARAA